MNKYIMIGLLVASNSLMGMDEEKSVTQAPEDFEALTLDEIWGRSDMTPCDKTRITFQRVGQSYLRGQDKVIGLFSSFVSRAEGPTNADLLAAINACRSEISASVVKNDEQGKSLEEVKEDVRTLQEASSEHAARLIQLEEKFQSFFLQNYETDQGLSAELQTNRGALGDDFFLVPHEENK